MSHTVKMMAATSDAYGGGETIVSYPARAPKNPQAPDGADQPYFIPGSVNSDEALRIRSRLALYHFKWDHQIEDISTLATFPLVLRDEHYRDLKQWSEALTQELFAAEDEICQDLRLLKQLGLPRKLNSCLARLDRTARSISAIRTLRFDFHFTTEGWKLSEVNSDVPGGFSESTVFTEMMARHFPEFEPTGLPGEVWGRKVSLLAEDTQTVVLLSAPGHMEDHQVVSYLAARLTQNGKRTYLANPAQIVWRDGKAYFSTRDQEQPLDVLVRFFQAEWFPLLPKHVQWEEYFVGGLTPVANPGVAAISESKRLPLIWDQLKCPMTTWRSLLPQTCDPREVRWQSDDSWILKTAYSNTGDTVSIREYLSSKQWSRVRWDVRLRPSAWLAQKRFLPVPMQTPAGILYPCIGVYTFDGITAGIYGRLGVRPWIDFSSIDVPVLIKRRVT